LISARSEPLVHFLPLVFDKLLLLLTRPPLVSGQTLMLQTAIFETLGKLVRKLKDLKELIDATDKHGRCSLITSYIQYRVSLPPLEAARATEATMTSSPSCHAMTSSTSPTATFTGVSTGGGFRPTVRPPPPPNAGETPLPSVFGRSNRRVPQSGRPY
jgi:hypothetical protein